MSAACLRGQPWPLGATPMRWQGRAGVNLAVTASHASEVLWCLFEESGAETARIALPQRTDGVWHGFLPGLAAGQLYGLRANGPWDPAAGHRFNPAKLLIDPYARELAGGARDLAREVAWTIDAAGAQRPDPTDNAARMPKARVIDLQRERAAGAAIAPPPRVAPECTLLYEAHVKGLTRLHPGVPEAKRGTYAGVASDAMLAHYRKLGVTTLCLLPVQRHIDEAHLLELGLANYWGYNTLASFVPEPGYAAARDAADARRISCHGGPAPPPRLRGGAGRRVQPHGRRRLGRATLSWRGLDNAGTYALDGGGQYLNFTGCGNANMGEPRMVQFVMDNLRWWVQAFGVDGFRFDLAVTLGREPLLRHQFNPNAALFTAMAQDPVLAPVKRIAEPWDVGAGGYQTGAFQPGWQEWNDRFDSSRCYWLSHVCTPGQLATELMTGSSDLFDHHLAATRSPAST